MWAETNSSTMAAMLAAVVGLAAVLNYALCWLMRSLSPKIGYLDYPGGRKDHARPMPIGGGVALILTLFIMIGGAVAVVLTGALEHWPTFANLSEHKAGMMTRLNQLGGVLAGAFILHVLGLIDDVKSLGAIFKLIFQFAVAAMVVIFFGVRLCLFIPIPAVSIAISILWIMTITNAFNFLDNADGLSAGVAVICGSVLLAVAAGAGQVFVSAFLAIVVGATVGFLGHNFFPARLYLGDAGSLPMGFLLSIGSILTTYYTQSHPESARTVVLVPLVVMAIPLYDSLSVIVLRFREKAPMFLGDHRHFSHRLIRRGLSVRDAVLTVYLACGATAVSAIVLRVVSATVAMFVVIQTLCVVAIIAILESKSGGDAKSES